MDKKDILNEVKKLLFGGEEPMDELKFVEAVLEDGTKIKVEGEELLEGLPVYVVTEEGDIAAPDGQHILEDGTVVETLEGLIVSVTKSEQEEELEEEEVVEEVFEEETTEEKSNEEIFNLMDEINKRLESVENFNKNIKEEYSKEIKNLKDATVLLTEEFSKLPGGDKVDLKKSGYESTINERLTTKQERLERIRKTLRG